MAQLGDSDVGDIVMLVTYVKLSPTHFVSNIGHQHRCDPQLAQSKSETMIFRVTFGRFSMTSFDDDLI